MIQFLKLVPIEILKAVEMKKSYRELIALIKVIEPTVLLLVDKGLKWQTLAK